MYAALELLHAVLAIAVTKHQYAFFHRALQPNIPLTKHPARDGVVCMLTGCDAMLESPDR